MLDSLLLRAAAAAALRLLLAGALLGGLAGLGLPLAARGGPRAGSDRRTLLLALACGFAVYQAAIRCLAFAGLATAATSLALLLAGLLLLLRAVRDGALGPVAPLPGTLPLLLVGLAPLPMALAPAVSADALVYHLRVPERTLATGAWAVDPTRVHTYFPLASSTLYLPSLALDESGSLAQLLHLSFFLLSLLALAELADDLAPGSGPMASMLYAAAPAALVVAGWAWTDHALAFALLAAALAVRTGAIVPGFLALGLACSLKYTGLSFSLPLAIALAARSRRRPAALAAGALAAAAVAAPWYVANVLATSNPVYPLLPGVFGGDPDSARYLERWAARDGDLGWLAYALAPRSLDSDLGGPAMAVLGAAALAWGLARPGSRILAACVLAALATLLPFQPNARVLLPLLAGVAPLVASLLRDAPGRLQVVRLLPALLLLRGLLISLGHDALYFGPLPCAVGLEPREAYLRRNLPFAPLFERAARLPEATRVLAIGEARVFRFPRASSAASLADSPALAPHLGGGTPESVLASLRAAGFTHVLATSDALKGKGRSVERLSSAGAALQAAALTRCRPLDREADLWLLAIPDVPR